jgi:hypothetical protein
VFARLTIRLTAQPNPDPTDRVEFWHVEPPGEESWLFVLVHGPDRRNATDGTRRIVFGRVRATTRLLEDRLGHRRTVVFGDLNSNPFEPSVLDADGLHALGVKRVLQEGTERGVRNAGRSDFFYNPMWRLYGYDPAGDAGAASYHYQGADATEPYWHMLDQVLIRPEHADRLPPSELQILTVAGVVALTEGDGRPDPDRGSDHLPIVFVLR